MAFFKFRKASSDPVAGAQPTQSVEQIRLRAKYRLAGASILVVLGVVGLPLLFDKQPRPLPVDTPIVFPDQIKPMTPAQPLVAPPAIASAPVASGTVVNGEMVLTETAQNKDVKAALPARLPVDAPKVAAMDKGAEKPDQKSQTKEVELKASKSAEAQRVQSLLDGKDIVSSAVQPVDAARFVVQVGAFAESGRAQDVRQKIERAGLKTYTQVAQTKDGPRIRVRVGPFGNKAEAEQAAEQIRKLNLPTAILSL